MGIGTAQVLAHTAKKLFGNSWKRLSLGCHAVVSRRMSPFRATFSIRTPDRSRL